MITSGSSNHRKPYSLGHRSRRNRSVSSRLSAAHWAILTMSAETKNASAISSRLRSLWQNILPDGCPVIESTTTGPFFLA